MAIERSRQAHNQGITQSLFRGGYDSSSFGPVGYISRVGTDGIESADRLKGFIGGESRADGRITPVSNPEHVAFIADAIREGVSRVESNKGITRLSIRTIVDNSMTPALENAIRETGAVIEAKMPAGGAYSIVYVGYNAGQRVLSDSQRDSHQAAIDDAIRQYGPGTSSLADLARVVNAHSNEYHTAIFNGSGRNFSAADTDRMATLLATFGYSRRTSIDLVHDERNIIGLVYKNSEPGSGVVGISITEERRIELSDGSRMCIAEVTDGMVSDSGKSLYTRLLSDVFAHITRHAEEITMIFAESKIMTAPLMRTAVIQGRSFGGILPNHARIRGQLESLTVTHLTREEMIAFTETFRQARETER